MLLCGAVQAGSMPLSFAVICLLNLLHVGAISAGYSGIDSMQIYLLI